MVGERSWVVALELAEASLLNKLEKKFASARAGTKKHPNKREEAKTELNILY
ncbi:MAG: hypothetical protein WCI93_02435 [bacterium]